MKIRLFIAFIIFFHCCICKCTGCQSAADRNFSNGYTVKGPHFGNNFALEVSQVVFAGGAISNNIKATELQAEIARLDLESLARMPQMQKSPKQWIGKRK